MKTPFNCLLLGVSILLLFSCKINKSATTITSFSKDDGLIEFTILQLNDVYEIAPLEGGQVGGMARVATIYKQLKKENPNTFFVLAGDFLNPSLLATMKYEGQRIKGRQMIEVMNACGVDLVVFGNHEFDVKEHELQARMNESNFDWIGGNILQVKVDSTVPGGKYLVPFHKEKNGEKEVIEETYTWTIKDADGTSLDIGILSSVIDKNQVGYVFYQNFMEEATKSYLELIGKTDLILGLTHLEINQDLQLAAQLPNVPLLMGGHEHHHLQYDVGNVSITKADANAKSAYVHRFTFNKKTGKHTLNSELLQITNAIQDDVEVKVIVDKWGKILNDKLSEIYPRLEEIIYKSTGKLDGRDAVIRTQPTKLGIIFAESLAAAAKKKVDVAFMNSGAVRLDDQLEGEIIAMDIFRAMPFGGQIWEQDIPGDILAKLLNIGLNEQHGSGDYFQTYNVTLDEKNQTWTIGESPLNKETVYHVAFNDYLYSRSASVKKILQQFPVDKPNKEDKMDARRDVRLAAIKYMKGLK